MTAPSPGTSVRDELSRKINSGEAIVAVCGLGYVGLPLSLAIAERAFRVIGVDVDEARVSQLNAGGSFLDHIPATRVARQTTTGRFSATADASRLGEADVILICVPTPLTRHREPEMRFIRETAARIAATLRPGQIIVLESTTYPGTTVDVMLPILRQSGLRAGEDFFVAFSPEREDPGNATFETTTIPKVVGGDGEDASRLATAFYSRFIDRVVPVSSTQTAEAVKLTENIFRAVNIALMNELKIVYGAMGIDIWEVIEAAKTKPFGYMPFYPGPGLGGHCIPIDPFYLTWKAREFDIATKFIELAGEINTFMPYSVVERLARELDRQRGRGLTGARVLVVGIAYKKNIHDIRESPALKILDILRQRGAEATYHDPHVPVFPDDPEYPGQIGSRSVPLTDAALSGYDAVLIATDHDRIDYDFIRRSGLLVIDTRNAFGNRGIAAPHIVKA